ncbi:MAG: DUF3429 domain-containing protein [Pseudomonadota bacterium]
MKKHSYQIFGYAGVIPFIVFAVGTYHHQDSLMFKNLYLMMQLFYAGLIIAFLSASYWHESLFNEKPLIQFICMTPVILLLPIFFWGMTHSPPQALLACIALFWGLFAMDRLYGLNHGWPKGYMLFRFNLTALVTLCLFATYWIGA